MVMGQVNEMKTARSMQLTNYLNARNKIAPLNASVLVTKGTEIITQGAFGISNAKRGESITENTAFLIASSTKPFTATTIMLLQQRGKLSLTDPVTKWLKGTPAAWNSVTLRHLLSHTSGIPDFITLKGGSALKPGLQNLVQLLKTTPLSYSPGARFTYSNTNFMLLSYVIEACTGTSYEAFMQTEVFKPLQMTNTGFAYPKAPNGLARSYRSVFKVDTLRREEEADLAVLKGAGGMYSTPADLVLFLAGLGKVLSPPTLDTMLQPVKEDYALGWHVQKQFGKLTLKHPGGINGFTSEMRFVPSDSLALVILSNMGSNDLNIRFTAFDILKIWNGETPGAELTVPAKYLGKYKLPKEYVDRFKSDHIEILSTEGKMVLSVPGNTTRFLIPADKGRYFFYGEPVDVEFGEEGKRMRILSPSLGKIECEKME
jgi:CubicO group peptidase (beta-lactamase class C family)